MDNIKVNSIEVEVPPPIITYANIQNIGQFPTSKKVKRTKFTEKDIEENRNVRKTPREEESIIEYLIEAIREDTLKIHNINYNKNKETKGLKDIARQINDKTGENTIPVSGSTKKKDYIELIKNYYDSVMNKK